MKQSFIKRMISALLILCMLIGGTLPLAPRVQAAATAASSSNASATLAYTLKNLKYGVAVQNFYIGAQYIYITQRSSNITYLSRLTISGNTATYKDHMTLTNWGHGETLDFYTYNGKEYFLVGSKADTSTDYCWSTQIARIQYVAGKSYSDYGGVTRFTTLDKANSDGSNDGTLTRVAAAVCGNYTIFRIHIKDKFVRYSIYDTNKLNAALDNTSTSVYLEMKSTAAQKALVKTFTQTGSTYVHPNSSFQGVELSSKDSIYLTGGNHGETPQIAMMNSSGSYKKLISVTNVGNYEIEGGQTDRGRFYFLVMPDTDGDNKISSAEKKNEQKIYYVAESKFGVSHTITNIAGTPATCTTNGISDGASCSHCNCPQDVQEVLPALGHDIVILPGKEPTATANGLTEGQKCARCNVVLVAQKEIGAADYSYVTAKPLQVVIDYDKSVRFTMDQLHSCLNYNSLDASVSFAGALTEGAHGNICYELPENLQLTKEGDRLKTGSGTFIRQKDSFLYTPEGMIEDVHSIYAVFHVKNIFNVQWYVMVAIQIVPATLVYYEAEKMAENGSLSFRESIEEDVNESITLHTDGGLEEVEVSTLAYDPTYDQEVFYLSFDDTEADRKRYSENPIYGNVNHDLIGTWAPVNTTQLHPFNGEVHNPPGALNLHLYDLGANVTWLQYRTAYSLSYKPSETDYIEVRMRLNDVKANNNNATISFVPEFFAVKNNGTLRTRPSVQINLSEVGNDWFILSFPYAHSVGWPGEYYYADAARIRSLSLSFEGMKPNYGQSISFDYFYIGPEEKRPSRMNADSLYFGFDNTTADQYRYNNSIYGTRNNFDKPLTQFDDWGYDPNRSPSVTVANGNLHMTVGAQGSANTNSPWVQTMENQQNQGMLDFVAGCAEYAQVKLKLSDLTKSIDPSYGLDKAVARLGFVLDEDSTYEASACWVDWELTDEQLSGSDYITLTAEIGKLLAERDAERIRAVRLTILNAASLSGTTGTVDIDYIYIGSGTTQGSSVYIPAPDTPKITNPTRESYTPNYDERVLYFSFDNTSLDKSRYIYNSIYGNSNNANLPYNYDLPGRWASSLSFNAPTVSGGSLHFAGTAANSYGIVGLNGHTLKYTPTNNDWVEIRLKVKSATASGSTLRMELAFQNAAGKQTKFNNTTLDFSKSHVGTENYFIITAPINDSYYWTDPNQSTSSYTGLGEVSRVLFLPSGFNKSCALSYSVDYFYLGPPETRPSQLNQEQLYFGFENDEAAQYKYATDLYGANYDNGNWDYHANRVFAPTFGNGTMSAIVKSSTSFIWLETKLGGYAGSAAMSYYPNKIAKTPEVVQVRVRFNNVSKYNSNDRADIGAFFYRPEDHATDMPTAIYEGIPDQELAANGKWFTYRIFLNDTLKNLGTNAEIDSFRIRFGNITGNGSTSKVEIDYIYVGPTLGAPEMDRDTPTYGYDETYTNGSVYSGHEAIFVEGKGAPLFVDKTNDEGEVELDENNEKIKLINYSSVNSYSEIKFTFKGTGFDIISRTGKGQGAIRVAVCAPNGDVKKAVSVLNQGNTDLCQIKVASVTGLAYDTYTAHIFVNEAYDFGDDGNEDIYGGALDRGGEFYLDAVRIYDPIDPEARDADSLSAYSAYQAHGEASPTFKELRNMLIFAGNFGEEMEGAVYLDATARGDATFDNENGRLDWSVAEYKAIGPNNEVYLEPGNAIAFKLEVEDTIPNSVDIGIKNITQKPSSLIIATAASALSAIPEAEALTITSATEQYYPVEIAASKWQSDGDKHYVYVAICNNGTHGILSITNFKFAYGVAGAKSRIRFAVDSEMIRKLNCEHSYAAVVTAPTCTEEGFTTFTCAGCGSFYVGERVGALGHDYYYESIGDHHIASCHNGCGYSVEEAHSFAEGNCICGAAEITGPVVDENLQFGEQLALENDLTLSFRLNPERIAQYDISTMYLEVARDVYGSDGSQRVETVILDQYEEDGNRLVFKLTGIAAAQMNDGIRATLHIKDAKGKEYVSPVRNTSVTTYLRDLLQNSASDSKLVTLIMDMLNYGTAAQIYFDRHADAPAREAFEIFKAYEGCASADFASALEDLSGVRENAGATGKLNLTLDLGTRIGIRYKLTLPADAEAADVTLVVTDAEGNVLETLAVADSATDSKGRYLVDFYGSTSRDMRRVVYATAYADGEAITGTYAYSISTYAWGIQENAATQPEDLVNVTRMMLLYGDSATAFFEG